jgi:hypothetical protein
VTLPLLVSAACARVVQPKITLRFTITYVKAVTATFNKRSGWL